MTPTFSLVELHCSGEECVCEYCGARATKPAKGFVLHGCNKRPRRKGLGDMVSAVLAAVGITKERVSKVLGRPCGCGKRQEALNKIGKRIGIG